MTDASKRVTELREQISHHDYLYYVMAKPEIGDREYDMLLKELGELEAEHPDLVTPDSPTQRVSGQPIEGFLRVEHSPRMLSIGNIDEEKEVRDFDESVRKALGPGVKFHYLVDPKVDGVAISLRYQAGQLVRAATRGDGFVGDDITANAKAIGAIPLSLRGEGWPDVLEVRGEVYWPLNAFSRFNAGLAAQNKELFRNSRNGTTGTLKQLDPRVVRQRGLSFMAHGFGEISQPIAPRASEMMEKLAQWGIPPNAHPKVCDDMKQVLAAIEGWETQRANVDYKTDGMVVKVDELAFRERMGVTDKFPKWCKAYKYQADQERTVLQEVTPQVGRTGVITPVASFAPVWLAGTMVANATLHNFDEIARLDIRKGDTIVVQKAGEVIPQVLRVDKDMRPAHSVPIEPPQECPSCGKALKWDPRKPRHTAFMCMNLECKEFFMQRRQRINPVYILVGPGAAHLLAPHHEPLRPVATCRVNIRGEDGGARGCDHPVQFVEHMVELRCVNAECPHQFRERLLHFAGRAQMDIEGIGEETVNLLLSSGMVKHFADLYRLTKDDLLRLELEERLKEDVAHKKLEEQLKGSAGRKLGAGVSAALASFFPDIYAVANADQQELMSTAGIDKESADRVYGKFHESKTADNLLAAIEASNHRGLARVLGALGIRGVGTRNARALAMAFPSIDDMMAANEIEIRDKFRKAMKSETSDKPAANIAKAVHEFFQQEDNIRKIDDLPEGLSLGDQIVRLGVPRLKEDRIREKRLPLLEEAFEDVSSLALASEKEIQDALEETGTVATSVYRFLHEEGGGEIVESLRQAGVRMTAEQPAKKAGVHGLTLEGKTVVVTGTLKGFSRKEAEDTIEQAGGKVGDGVSGKTSFVVVGADPGTKADKAREFGIETIDEEEFSRRLQHTKSPAKEKKSDPSPAKGGKQKITPLKERGGQQRLF